MSFLDVSNLQASYGKSQALYDVSFSVDKGEVVALMGRNGMGKSTTIKAICKMLPLAGGDIRIDGNSLLKIPSFKAARLGVGLVPEGRRCFPNLSVEENLSVAARNGFWTSKSVTDLFPRLAERSGQMANTLSGGEQQMLAIGRALMTNPRLLMLDEATEGLAPIVRQEIWKAIRLLKESSGLSLLIVDKSLRELSQVSDRAVILERGKSVWDGRLSNLDADTVQRFLGV